MILAAQIPVCDIDGDPSNEGVVKLTAYRAGLDSNHRVVTLKVGGERATVHLDCLTCAIKGISAL